MIESLQLLVYKLPNYTENECLLNLRVGFDFKYLEDIFKFVHA